MNIQHKMKIKMEIYYIFLIIVLNKIELFYL